MIEKIEKIEKIDALQIASKLVQGKILIVRYEEADNVNDKIAVTEYSYKWENNCKECFGSESTYIREMALFYATSSDVRNTYRELFFELNEVIKDILSHRNNNALFFWEL